MNTLVVRYEKCAGCRICELVCTTHHFKVNNPKKSAIRVIQLFPEPAANVPIVCRQCTAPPCAEDCPVDAIYKTKDGTILIDSGKCIGCKACLEACPLGAIFFHHDISVPIKCDLCNGNPVCVKYCPTKALEFVPLTIAGQSKRIETAQRIAGK